jgi:hypothetical protein
MKTKFAAIWAAFLRDLASLWAGFVALFKKAEPVANAAASAGATAAASAAKVASHKSWAWALGEFALFITGLRGIWRVFVASCKLWQTFVVYGILIIVAYFGGRIEESWLWHARVDKIETSLANTSKSYDDQVKALRIQVASLTANNKELADKLNAAGDPSKMAAAVQAPKVASHRRAATPPAKAWWQ